MSPTTQLFQRHLDAQGLTLETLALRLAPRNVSRTLEKLRTVFHQDGGTQAMIRALRHHLQIPFEDWEAALQAENQVLHEANHAWQRTHFTPHLWIELNESFIPVPEPPSLQQRRIELPETLVHLLMDPIRSSELADLIGTLYQSARRTSLKEAERLAQASIFGGVTTHSPTFPKEWIAHFLYRTAFDLAYRFTPDGQCVATVVGPYVIPNFPHAPTRF